MTFPDDLFARELIALTEARRVLLAFDGIPRTETPPEEIVQQARRALRVLVGLLADLGTEVDRVREVRDILTGVLYDRVKSLTIDSIGADGAVSPTQVRRAAREHAGPRRAAPPLPEDLLLQQGVTPATYRTPDGYQVTRSKKAWRVVGPDRPEPISASAQSLSLAYQVIERDRAARLPATGTGHDASLEVSDPSPTVPSMADALDRPSTARMYDYLLGGQRNFQIDRTIVDMVKQTNPEVEMLAQQSRAFMGRAVRLLSRFGVKQFLDIGSGIPTQGNVHEVAQAIDEQARVVYVDNDPQAVTFAEEILGGAPGVVAMTGDLRHPQEILGDTRARALLDFEKPVAILIVATLHFVDDAAFNAVDELVKATTPGSYLAISHLTPRPEAYAVAKERTRDRIDTVHPRTPEDVMRFFRDMTFVPPGLVEVRRWRPDTPRIADAVPDDQTWMVAGVACKHAPDEDAT
uniref:SAM-dependent methyltransferase n=1 Tax=Nonomuraea sp. CA-251285 TaxID=3240002 RepID=UPI003F498337